MSDAQAVIATDQRSGADRRRTPYLLSDWRYASVAGAAGRAGVATMPTSVHVDWYPSSLLACALTLVVLSVVDATLTLHLMSHGVVQEANPFMAPLIAHDVRLFVGVKMLVTTIGAVALVVYARQRLFRVVPMRRIGWYLAAFYALLVGYEVLLVRYAT